MPIYRAPIRDMRFLLEEVLDAAQLQELNEFEDIDIGTIQSILEEGEKFCVAELLPLFRSADEEGCRLEDGDVFTPKGFRDAFRAFREGGWNSIAMAKEYGGQGLPKTVAVLFEELACATNASFALYQSLTNGAYNALVAYASEELKKRYLPRLASGSWAASMCLTEPHSGSDLGLLRTKAVAQSDGSYRISGTKIFITGGDHDLNDNILHLVLARVPDAPSGIKGISLFLVPKYMDGDDGTTGRRNGVTVGSIEHKMGIKGSATCVMNFDEAEGYLVGDVNQGMRAMFKMMNAERVTVGVQGLAAAEIAYQNAAAYAKERLQGRSLSGPKNPEEVADRIIVHGDVRRMLLTMRAITEGCRALATWLAIELDLSNYSRDLDRRRLADERVALLTPVMKAFTTDRGLEAAVMGQQIFGGHGYIREHGMEQLVRDVRIAQIYEGANGIQALDLIGRKLGLRDGQVVAEFFGEIQGFIDANIDQLRDFVEPLAVALAALRSATTELLNRGAKNPEDIGTAAVPYLDLFGYVTLAYLWGRMAHAAVSGNEPFHETKLKTARFYLHHVLPRIHSLTELVSSGSEFIMAYAEDEF